MATYTYEEFVADAALLGAVGDFGARQVNVAWRARMQKAHPDAGGSEEAAKRLNLARDRLLEWIKAGKPAWTSEARPEETPEETKEEETEPESVWLRVKTWRPPPVLQETHHIFGVSVVVWFGGLLTVCMGAQVIWDLGPGILSSISMAAPDPVGVAIAARVGWLGYGKYKRDIAKICPACKKKGVLRKTADIHQYSDWHQHESTVSAGAWKTRKEMDYSTTHHFSAFYRCEACGHEFQHNYKRFVMNNPSMNRPHDLMIGILRIILQI